MKISRIVRYIFLGLMVCASLSVSGQTVPHAGFTGDEILISNETPSKGETVRLSIPLYNESGGVITGMVRLYEKDKKIGEQSITLKTASFSGVTFEWEALSGAHMFVFKLEDTTILYPKKTKEVVILENREAKGSLTTQLTSADSIPSNEEGLLKEYSVDDRSETNASTNSIDTYRQDFLYDIEDKVKAIRRDISESVQSNAEYEERLTDLRSSVPRSDGSLLTPLQYVYAWLLGAAVYVISNAYLFYGLGILILFFVIRIVIKRVRRTHR